MRETQTLANVLSRTTVTESGCWLWPGATNNCGYGKITANRRTISTHKYVYEQSVGPVPLGLDLDHLCRNRLCCNPDHLEPVTRQVNILRGETVASHRARQTACKAGHPLSGGNLYLPPSGGRRCRTCRANVQGREVSYV